MVGNYSQIDGGCATYGKVFVGNESDTGIHGVDASFQLHAVRASARPSGELSVRDLERRFSAALKGLDSARGAPLKENSVALYVDDLDGAVGDEAEAPLLSGTSTRSTTSCRRARCTGSCRPRSSSPSTRARRLLRFRRRSSSSPPRALSGL